MPMEVCTSFDKLKPLLDGQPEENTFGVVFIPEVLDVHDVIAVRTSVKWCDATVVVCLKDVLKASHHKILQNAGVDILLSCPPSAPKLDLDSGDIASGFVLKVILAIMPSAVVVQQAKIDLLRVVLMLNRHYTDLFTPIFSETPVGVLSETEQEIREFLVAIKESAEGGELDMAKLSARFKSALQHKYRAEGLFRAVSSDGTTCAKSLSAGENYLHVAARLAEGIICDSVLVKAS